MAARLYQTRQGDTFDIVAYRIWGDEHMMRQIVDANPEYADVLLFDAGIMLNIPDIAKKAKLSADLPSWY